MNNKYLLTPLTLSDAPPADRYRIPISFEVVVIYYDDDANSFIATD